MTLGAISALEQKTMFVCFSSFGYKYGLPGKADMAFDCRSIANLIG